MTLTILKAEKHRRMPWKNGGGVTVEIAVYPEGASVDNFDWRISMATVASDGPFSIFPGIDRTLSVLEGDGILLDVEGQANTLTCESAPLSFAADAHSNARLIGSAITDLNVMTRRGHFAHRVERHIASSLQSLSSNADLTILLAIDPFSVLTAEGPLDLQPLDALLLEGVDRMVTLSAGNDATFYMLGIDQLERAHGENAIF